MADIAQIGFSADTSELKDAKASLEALVPAAERVDKANAKVTSSFDAAGNAADRAARGLSKSSAAASGASGAVDNAASAASVYATAANNAATASFSFAGGFDVLTGKANANFAAINANLTKIGALKKGVDEAAQSMKFGAYETLGFSRQLADIGVTAAMGMNPLMIALQQGPQLFDILATKAAMTGTTIGTVFKAAGAQIYAALAPLLPIIALIGTAIGLVVGAFALATRAINEGQGKVVDGLNLTERQLKKLEKAGIDTTVTLGDTFKAFFVTVGQELATAFDGPLSGLKSAWKESMDFITEYGIAAVKIVVGTFAGSVSAIEATWSALPGAIGDIFIQAVNGGIDALNSFIEWIKGVPSAIYDFFTGIPGFFNDLWSKAVNLATDALNWFVQGIPKAVNYIRDNWWKLLTIIPYVIYEAANKAIAGIQWMINKVIEGVNILGGHLANADFGHIDNPFSGEAAAAAKTGSKAFIESYDAAGDAVDEFGRKWKKNAEDIARKRILGKAGDPGKTPKGPKTEAEKFEDLTAGMARDIAMTEAKTRAVDMTAEAALRLENQQKALNDAEAKGIHLNEKQKAVLLGLADQLTDAQLALKKAEWWKETNEGIDQQIKGLNDAHDIIGLYGEDLARAQYEQQLFNKAIQDHITLSAEDIKALKARAAEMAAQGQTNVHDQYIEDRKKQHEDEMFMLDRERGEIGLTGAALAAYQYETDALAEARSKNIALTPDEIAAIRAAGVEYAATAEQITKTKQAIDFFKETSKGFVTDFLGSLKDGASIWDSFANAAINALDKILNKIIDSQLDQLLGSLFDQGSGGGGIGGFLSGLFNAKGNAFGAHGVTPFAKGGSFTNSIVSNPTLFKFAQGGSLGVMGEAGPEAIMPLQRGSDGNLGVRVNGGNGAGGGLQQVELIVRAVEGDMFKPVVESIADDRAVKVVHAGLQQYNDQLPDRVSEITADPRVR